MLTRAFTFTIDGVAPRLLCVEVDVRAGLPSTTFIGLGDAVVREAREGVRCALQNTGFLYPQQRVSVNLAPASPRGRVAGLRLAAAVGMLAASGQLDPLLLEDTAVYGHLALSGEITSLPGSVVAARACARHGIRRLLLPAAAAAHAAALAEDDVEVLEVLDLGDLARVLAGGAPTPLRPQPCGASNEVEHPDLADMLVEPTVIFALQLAAAGGHHLLLEGPSGSGHTMLARRLPGIMAPLSRPQALEVAQLHDIAGPAPRLSERPARRAPHHTISLAGLLGGGSPVRPGEATLAHHGVLYLHELESFQSCALQALGIAARERQVTLVRGERALRFPTSFTLLGSLCIDEPDAGAVRRRIAPIRPSFDLRVYTPRLTPANHETLPVIDSATVRARVIDARGQQAGRGQTVPNADLPFESIAARCTPRAAAIMQRAYDTGAVGSHGRARLARVAQTIADLYFAWPDGRVDEHAVREALPFTGCPWVL